METTFFAVLPCALFHAVMLPVIEAKMNAAGAGAGVGVGVAGALITKSDVELLTTPVGRPPGMFMVCGFPLSTTGAPPTSPRMSCVVLVALLATQKGLAEVAVMPHGLAKNGSRTGAKPGISEIKLVCR